MVHEVVIIGGGFGGVRVAKILSRWSAGWRNKNLHITLIDKSRYHTFHPNLYEVAAAHLPEAFGHIPVDYVNLKSAAIYPLEEIFLDDLNVTVLDDEVLNIDFKARKILLKNSPPKNYDFLVVGTGSETNYFNITNLNATALPLKNFFDALMIRNSIDEAFVRLPKNRNFLVANF